MKPLFTGKTWVILLTFIGLAGLAVLAAGLSGMEFDQPGVMGFDTLFNLSDPTLKKEVPASAWLRYALIIMIAVIFLLFLGPIRPQSIKDLIKRLLRSFLVMVVIMLFLSRIAPLGSFFAGSEQNAQTQNAGSPVTPQTFAPPEVSSQLEFWITASIVLVTGAVAIVISNRFIDRWFAPKKGLNEFAEIARCALDDLSKNKESRNAIIRCYTRMNAAVNEYRGIAREAAMTPAEFAERLAGAGLPSEAVHGLTRVFEKVRYGGQSVSVEEIKEAKQCLTSILKACEAKL